jgi:hypothetical protein
MKELLTHFIIFAPFVIFVIIITLLLSSLNIFLWIPYIIYITYILVKAPNHREMDLFTELGNKLNLSVQSNIYEKTFQCEIEEDLDNTPKLYVWHPHGLQCISYLVHRIWEKSPLHPILKKSKLAVHSMIFQVPILRELAMMMGFIPATKENILHYLEKGVSVSLFPGGVKEMSFCSSEENICYIKKRKGFLDIAKEYKIVPVYVHGEQNFFKTSDYDLDLVNTFLGAFCGYSTNLKSIELFAPTNIVKWIKVYFGVEADSTYTYVSKPIQPQNMDEYVENLETIYNRLKDKLNIKNELIIM